MSNLSSTFRGMKFFMGYEAPIGSYPIPAQTGIQRVDHRSTLARCIHSHSGS
jgi:hypothetical protein